MQNESTNTKHTETINFNKALFKVKKINKIILILKFIESKRLAKSHYNKMAMVWCRKFYHRVLLQNK